MEEGQLNLPQPKNLPGVNISTHHAFVADEALPLKLNIMRPYPQRNLGDPERIFNYRLSRARRTIENTFGILVARWRVLETNLCFSPENATLIVSALVCLHNFLMSDQLENGDPRSTMYCPPEMVDQETEDHEHVDGEWRRMNGHSQLQEIGRRGANNATREAIEQRARLRDYFLTPIGEAQASWQYTRAFRGLVLH